MQGLVHLILKAVIQTYKEPMVEIQSNYENFEQDVLSKSMEALGTNRVYIFRRHLFIIKSMLKQTQNAINHCKIFWIDHESLHQDLLESIDQIYYQLDDISYNFDQLFALHLSINERKSNEVMKVLTIFASIMLPLTFVASFYGMNFDYLPGAHSMVGFLILSFLMLLIGGGTIWYFKRNGWFKQQRN